MKKVALLFLFTFLVSAAPEATEQQAAEQEAADNICNYKSKI